MTGGMSRPRFDSQYHIWPHMCRVSSMQHAPAHVEWTKINPQLEFLVRQPGGGGRSWHVGSVKWRWALQAKVINANDIHTMSLMLTGGHQGGAGGSQCRRVGRHKRRQPAAPGGGQGARGPGGAAAAGGRADRRPGRRRHHGGAGGIMLLLCIQLVFHLIF